MVSGRLKSFIMNEDGVPFFCASNRTSESVKEIIIELLVELQQGKS